MDEDTRYWLALNRNDGLSPRQKLLLLSRFRGCPRALLEAARVNGLPVSVSAFGLQELRQPDWRGVDNDLAWLDGDDRHMLKLGDASYPEALSAIDDPPIVLFVQGDPEVLCSPQIAMVGSRAASRAGRIDRGCDTRSVRPRRACAA